jgi:hypothetical protein
LRLFLFENNDIPSKEYLSHKATIGDDIANLMQNSELAVHEPEAELRDAIYADLKNEHG